MNGVWPTVLGFTFAVGLSISMDITPSGPEVDCSHVVITAVLRAQMATGDLADMLRVGDVPVLAVLGDVFEGRADLLERVVPQPRDDEFSVWCRDVGHEGLPEQFDCDDVLLNSAEFFFFHGFLRLNAYSGACLGVYSNSGQASRKQSRRRGKQTRCRGVESAVEWV